MTDMADDARDALLATAKLAARLAERSFLPLSLSEIAQLAKEHGVVIELGVSHLIIRISDTLNMVSELVPYTVLESTVSPKVLLLESIVLVKNKWARLS